MNYEEAISVARQYSQPVPSYEGVARSKPLRRIRMRRILASLGVAAATYGYLGIWVDAVWGSSVLQTGGVSFLLPLALLALCARLLWTRTFRAQLILRALLWSNLIIGTVLSVFIAAPVDGPGGALVALGCGLALFALGGKGLGDTPTDPTFRPTAFFGRLSVALAMAVADTQTLLFSAIGQSTAPMLEHGWKWSWVVGDSYVAWLAAGAMGIAVWGLLRLRTWALVLNIVVNFAVAYLALHGALGVSVAVAGALTMTAVLQLLLPVPLLAAALGDRGVRMHSAWWEPLIVKASVLGLTVLALPGIKWTRPLARTTWVDYTRHNRTAVFEDSRGNPQGQAPEFPAGPSTGLDPQLAANGHKIPWECCTDGLHDHQHRLTDLRGADLRGYDLSDATFLGADLTGADLSKAMGKFTLSHSAGVGVRAVDADWSEATLNSSDLRIAVLRGLHAEASFWLDSDLRGADFSGATLDSAHFRGSSLSNSSFRGASLRDAIIAVSLEHVDLTDADLSGAHNRGRPINFAGAIISNTVCPDGRLSEAHGGTCPALSVATPPVKDLLYFSAGTTRSGRRDRLDVQALLVVPPKGGGLARWLRALLRTRTGGSVIFAGTWRCDRVGPLFPWATYCADGKSRSSLVHWQPEGGAFTLDGARITPNAHAVRVEPSIEHSLGGARPATLEPATPFEVWLRLPAMEL